MATLQVGITHAWSEQGPSNRVTQNLRTFPKQPQALHDPNLPHETKTTETHKPQIAVTCPLVTNHATEIRGKSWNAPTNVSRNLQ